TANAASQPPSIGMRPNVKSVPSGLTLSPTQTTKARASRAPLAVQSASATQPPGISETGSISATKSLSATKLSVALAQRALNQSQTATAQNGFNLGSVPRAAVIPGASPATDLAALQNPLLNGASQQRPQLDQQIQPRAQQQPEPLPNPLLYTLRGHTGAVLDVAVSPDGKMAVSTGADETLRVWSTADGKLMRTIQLDNGAAQTVDIQGGLVATGHRGGFIGIWDMASGAKRAALRRNEADIWSLQFTGTKGHIAAASHDWQVVLWNVSAPATPLHVFEAHDNAVLSLAVSQDGRRLISGSADNRTRLWNLDTLERIRTFRRSRNFVSAVALSSTARRAAAGDAEGRIVVGRTNRNRLNRTLRGHSAGITALSFLSQDKYLASASEDGHVRIWNIARRRTIKTLADHTGKVTGLTTTPDNRLLISSGTDGTVRIWDVKRLLR
ncbi:MAG: WD40 repeat domain-containing protein, partial [Pseudomonadota bacterium]